MRVSQVVTLLFFGVAAFLVLGISSADANGEIITTTNNSEFTIKISRKLKGINGKVHLDDYRPYDPSPSLKTSIRPGPIEHRTPLMPFIPKRSSPPSPPNSGH